MTSTPDDGEIDQQHAEQSNPQTDIPHEAGAGDLDNPWIEEQTSLNEANEDEDELPQFDALTGSDNDPPQASRGDALSVVEASGATFEQDTASEGSVQSLSQDIPSQQVRYGNRITRGYSPSVDDTASIPDDTPSIRGSALSSPRTESLSRPPASRKNTTPPRRPFDLRFQSRLSSSSLLSPRPSSPNFLNAHSRQSSLASQGILSASEGPDDTDAPWEVIRWHRLTKTTTQIFSEAARRNFGNPTCLAVSDQVIIGTSKGLVLIFDHQQNHKAIIGSGTPAVEAGAVTALAISADHTAIAAGHASGHVFTWEVGRHARPFLHVTSIDHRQPWAKSADGHVIGSTVLHIGFLGFRRTALVSADDRGMAFSHLASRGTGALGRTVHTTRILGRYPDLVVRSTKPVKKSSVLAFSALPLGNVEQRTDSLGLVAMLTPYLLVIVSTTPVAQTQHKAARPKDVAAHGAMTAALAWFPAIKLKGGDSAVSTTKLVYAWSDVLTVLEVHEIEPEKEEGKEKPIELHFVPRSRFKSEEAIVAVQWLSRSVIAVLTITQQLLIIEDGTMVMTDAFDLLPKDLYHADVYSHQLQSIIENLDEEDSSMHGVVADAFHMSFRAYKGRLFLLGCKNIWWGSLTNWADRLLAMMDAGDFIGAIRLATSYYSGLGEKLTIGLPEDDDARHDLVREKLLEMISASLKYAFGKNEIAGSAQLGPVRLTDLAVASVSACFAINNQDFLFEEVFTWYDENNNGAMFIDVLEPYILDGKIRSLPPLALKTLINHFKTTHTSSQLEEIICLLDPTAMDIDQVTGLCKHHRLYDAYVYVWNTALMDFVTPLQELLDLVLEEKVTNGYFDGTQERSPVAQKMFAYLSFTLTGRVYPTGLPMDDAIATSAKLQIYDFLFSGKDGTTSGQPGSMTQEALSASSFPRLREILQYDTPSFMGVMNEAFEDNFLNTSLEEDLDTPRDQPVKRGVYARPFLIQILLAVMSTGFNPSDTIYLDMFIARNLPKYSQYILLSGSTLHNTFTRLCKVDDDDLRDDAQLSIEYLLSVYKPPDPLAMVPVLRGAGFYRVLKSIFRQEQRPADLIDIYFLDPDDQEGVFDVIQEYLRPGSNLASSQAGDVLQIVRQRAFDLTGINVARCAAMVDNLIPEAHSFFIQAQSSDPEQQFRYLRELIEPDLTQQSRSSHIDAELLGLYVKLMCRYNAGHVVDYIKSNGEADLKLEAVLPAMETSGAIDAAAILLTRQGHVREGMDRLLKHLSKLKTALRGILETAAESPDQIGTNEAIEDLLETIDRYSGVGIWICQRRFETGSKTRLVPKSPKRTPATPVLTFEEQIWLDLLLAIVSIAQDVVQPSSPEPSHLNDEISIQLRTTVQRAFTALLTSTTVTKEGSQVSSDQTFLRILRAFLTAAAGTSPSLSALRNVIGSIFSAYTYEESLLSLSNAMLDKDLFVHVDEVSKLRQLGWRPRGQICEICKRRVWGPGTGLQIWKAWEIREQQRTEQRNAVSPLVEDANMDNNRGKGKATAPSPPTTNDENPSESNSETSSGPLVVFSCRHICHRACLIQRDSATFSLEEDHHREEGEQRESQQQQQQLSAMADTSEQGSQVHFRCPLCH